MPLFEAPYTAFGVRVNRPGHRGDIDDLSAVAWSIMPPSTASRAKQMPGEVHLDEPLDLRRRSDCSNARYTANPALLIEDVRNAVNAAERRDSRYGTAIGIADVAGDRRNLAADSPPSASTAAAASLVVLVRDEDTIRAPKVNEALSDRETRFPSCPR